jgi:plastocyanin
MVFAQQSSSTTTTITTEQSYPYSFQVLGYTTSDPILLDRFGYGSEMDLLAHDGQLNDSMMQNRVIVHLRADAQMTDDKLEPANGMLRGTVDDYMVNPFDPVGLDIKTGTTVTFWADSGHHSIECINHQDLLPEGSAPVVPGHIYSFTFLKPGHYRIIDGFVAGAAGTDNQGLLIKVHGNECAMSDIYPGFGVVSSTTQTTTETTQVETTTQQQSTIPWVEMEKPNVESDVPSPPPPAPAPAPAPPKARVRDTDSK